QRKAVQRDHRRVANKKPGIRASFPPKLEAHRVDAIPQAGRLRAVGEDVAEMPAAFCAGDLDAVHAVAEVVVLFDLRAVDRVPEARPATAGVELRLRGEKLGAAAGADVD